MMQVDMVGGLLILISVILIVCIYRKTHKKGAAGGALPPRVSNASASAPVSPPYTQDPHSTASGTRPLPVRSPHHSMTQAVWSGETGPRGITPDQYPVCPIDRQRNEIGESQKIFWNAAESCYHCTHGHRFKSNGRLMSA